MSALRTLQVDCGGRAAHVEVVGEGPEVVMVGTAAPVSLIRPAALALADFGLRVVNFHYGSGADEPEPRTALAQVADVASVMAAVGVEACALVGVSRGAMTAFGFAARYPALVHRLVLVAPVAGWHDVIDVVDPIPDSDPEDPDGLLKQVFSQDFLESSREQALSFLTTPPGTVDRVQRSEEDRFGADLRVDCPTLIVTGGGDLVVSAAHPARYQAEIPGSIRIDVPDASHAWIMEDPGGFAGLVEEFLRA